MNKILFRADAKPAIGTGDLVSLIHLARVFEDKGWETHFMIRDSEGGRKLMADYAIKHFQVLPDALSVEKELSAINQYLTERRITHFFACITERLLTEYSTIHPDVIKGCINFDGIIPEKWALVVNWNFPPPGLYKQDDHPGTRFLLGPEFVILPDNFDQDAIARRVFKRPIKKLLIAMGGADEFNLTTRVVRKIIDEHLDLQLTIILGAAFRAHDELRSALQSSGLACVCKTAVTDMFAEYMNCDAAIGTGGLTSSELVATHTPALLVSAYKHQTARCRYFHEQGMAIHLGGEIGSINLKKSLSALEKFGAANFPMRFHGRQAIFDQFKTAGRP